MATSREFLERWGLSLTDHEKSGIDDVGVPSTACGRLEQLAEAAASHNNARATETFSDKYGPNLPAQAAVSGLDAPQETSCNREVEDCQNQEVQEVQWELCAYTVIPPTDKKSSRIESETLKSWQDMDCIKS